METATRLPNGGKNTGKIKTEKNERNMWCPEYDACLGAAAFNDLPLDCRNCPSRNMQVAVFVLTLSEIEGCKALVNAIFRSSRN